MISFHAREKLAESAFVAVSRECRERLPAARILAQSIDDKAQLHALLTLMRTGSALRSVPVIMREQSLSREAAERLLCQAALNGESAAPNRRDFFVQTGLIRACGRYFLLPQALLAPGRFADAAGRIAPGRLKILEQAIADPRLSLRSPAAVARLTYIAIQLLPAGAARDMKLASLWLERDALSHDRLLTQSARFIAAAAAALRVPAGDLDLVRGLMVPANVSKTENRKPARRRAPRRAAR